MSAEHEEHGEYEAILKGSFDGDIMNLDTSKLDSLNIPISLENKLKRMKKKYNKEKKEGKTMTGKPETKVEVEPEVNEKKK